MQLLMLIDGGCKRHLKTEKIVVKGLQQLTQELKPTDNSYCYFRETL